MHYKTYLRCTLQRHGLVFFVFPHIPTVQIDDRMNLHNGPLAVKFLVIKLSDFVIFVIGLGLEICHNLKFTNDLKTFNHYLSCSIRWVSDILEIFSLSNFTWDFFKWGALSRILSPQRPYLWTNTCISRLGAL